MTLEDIKSKISEMLLLLPQKKETIHELLERRGIELTPRKLKTILEEMIDEGTIRALKIDKDGKFAPTDEGGIRQKTYFAHEKMIEYWKNLKKHMPEW